VIVSSDTIIELDGSIYEKPKDKETQFKNLQKFRDSATPLVVMTGVVIITPSSDLSKEENDVQLHSHVEKTKLYFDKTLSDELIQSYVDSEDGLKVAAGFKIQSTGALLIDGIEGDYYNVVGLPLRATFKLLETAVVSKSYNT
jgi:septum formation protein